MSASWAPVRGGMGSHDTATRTGETLEARYRLDRYLGDDGTTEVYAATDTRSDNAVVVRLLRPEFALQRAEIERFVALPKQLVKVSAPHVARVFEVTSDDTGIPFVVEEALAGRTLAELLAEHPQGLPLSDACRVVGPMVEAIARLHMAGVVHGHINPSRIVLASHAKSLVPRIVHFSAVVQRDESLAAYRAPEADDSSVDEETTVDVWALGRLMHHVFTGRLPGETSSADALQQTWPEMPAAVCSAIADSLHPNPRKRLPDAAVLWMRVEGALTIARPSAVTPDPDPVSETDTAAAPIDDVADEPVVEVPGVDVVATEREVASVEAVVAQDDVAVSRAADAVAVVAAKIVATKVAAEAKPARDVPLDVTRPAPQRARTPGTLNDLQLKQLLALGEEEEHWAWRWLRRLLLLLLLFLFYRSTAYLTEPDFATAYRVFGPKLQLVVVAFSAVAVVAMVRVWAYSAKVNVALLRPVVYTFVVVVLCIGALSASAYFVASGYGAGAGAGGGFRAGGGGGGGGPLWQFVTDAARTVLPYGIMLLLALSALVGLMNGVQSFGSGMALALAGILLSLGAGAASVDLAMEEIKDRMERARASADDDEEGDGPGFNLAMLKAAFAPKKIDVSKPETVKAVRVKSVGAEPELRQRTTIGDGDDTSVMIEDMRRQRTHQKAVIKATE